MSGLLGLCEEAAVYFGTGNTSEMTWYDGEHRQTGVFRAEGSQGDVYTVIVGAGRDVCSCPAGLARRPCYHARAAHLFMARKRSGVA
jgi:hypothetical protein